MRNNKFLNYLYIYGISFLIIIAVVITAITDMPTLRGIDPRVWFVIIALILQIALLTIAQQRQLNTIPEMFISEANIENKRFGDKEYHLTPYIEVSCKNAKAENVYPIIEWLNLDGDFHINTNQGRWWIASSDLANSKVGLQMVNIEPNGMSMRLHFGILSNEGWIQAWYRMQDGIEKRHFLKNQPASYVIRITLNSSNKGYLTKQFQIDNPAPHTLDLVPLSKRRA